MHFPLVFLLNDCDFFRTANRRTRTPRRNPTGLQFSLDEKQVGNCCKSFQICVRFYRNAPVGKVLVSVTYKIEIDG